MFRILAYVCEGFKCILRDDEALPCKAMLRFFSYILTSALQVHYHFFKAYIFILLFHFIILYTLIVQFMGVRCYTLL